MMAGVGCSLSKCCEMRCCVASTFKREEAAWQQLPGCTTPTDPYSDAHVERLVGGAGAKRSLQWSSIEAEWRRAVLVDGKCHAFLILVSISAGEVEAVACVNASLGTISRYRQFKFALVAAPQGLGSAPPPPDVTFVLDLTDRSDAGNARIVELDSVCLVWPLREAADRETCQCRLRSKAFRATSGRRRYGDRARSGGGLRVLSGRKRPRRPFGVAQLGLGMGRVGQTCMAPGMVCTQGHSQCSFRKEQRRRQSRRLRSAQRAPHDPSFGSTRASRDVRSDMR